MKGEGERKKEEGERRKEEGGRRRTMLDRGLNGYGADPASLTDVKCR
jgi:hypothetical protein